MGRKINCIGCGRTDAGVHASQFYCHIVVDKEFDFDPVFRLNKMLPDDISVKEMIPVSREAHAQHDAVSRTYTYRIHTFKDSFLSEISALYPLENIDFIKMKKAVEMLLRFTDFRSQCKQPDIYKNTLCIISKAEMTVLEGGKKIVFKITADRFLRGMVRIIIGNILEVGYGRMSLKEFESCFIENKPAAYFKMAYPQGLYLSEVKYKDEVLYTAPFPQS